MFSRLLNPSPRNSFFLFGARGSGKSTWLRQWSSDKKALFLDLLDADLENRYLTAPGDFKQQVLRALETGRIEWVIVDEIQKCPALLNYAHWFIEEKKLRFAMSGSSARRLKQKGVNLLAGRAFLENLFPLTHREMGESFSLEEALAWGSLPALRHLDTDQERRDYLKTYALTYVQHEVQAEQWVRNLVPFRKFLPLAAQMNNRILNYQKIARELGVDWTTVRNYFDILEDSLIGYRLEPFDRSVRKRQRRAPKFYFFDLGVKRALENMLGSPPVPRTAYYGECFEHFVFLEIYRLNILQKKGYELYYLCTKDGVEVDLILRAPGQPLQLVEIKSTEQVREEDVKSLEQIGRSLPRCRKLLLSRDPIPRKIRTTEALPWASGIGELA